MRITATTAITALLASAATGVLIGCEAPSPSAAVSEPDPDLVFVRSYRSDADTCQLTGESAFTVDFLDHTADLVTCPTGSEDAASLVATTTARVVTQTNSYTLYSVPRG